MVGPGRNAPQTTPSTFLVGQEKRPNDYKHNATETKSEVVKSIKCVRSEIHRSPKQFIRNRLSDIRPSLERFNGHNLLFQNKKN